MPFPGMVPGGRDIAVTRRSRQFLVTALATAMTRHGDHAVTLESAVIRLARDAELELGDEGGRTQLELVERQLRRRRRSGVTRLEIGASASAELVGLLCLQLDITADDVTRTSAC
jgi:polyphosphate kinase